MASTASASAPPLTTAAATTNLHNSLCTCPHLNHFLETHPQTTDNASSSPSPSPPLNKSATASAALTSVAEWLGAPSQTRAALIAAIPHHGSSSVPTSDFQALGAMAAALDLERRGATSQTWKAGAGGGGGGRRLVRLSHLLPRCQGQECHEQLRTMMACLECVHIGCWIPLSSSSSNSSTAHSRTHAQEKDHQLALDMSRMSIYCFSCNDFVYHPLTEQLLTTIKRDAFARKRRRDQLESTSTVQWPATTSRLFNDKVKWVGSDPLAGLRGMYNLGNTCFMSVVLQSLLHNPLLRNYFLSDMHNPHRCPRRMKLAPNGATAVCIACDIDELFSTFYSGDHAPYLPDHFLYSMWTHADHLAGYAQQDAHELLMAVIDGIHSSCIESSNGPPPKNGGTHSPCTCIIHTVFGGTLRSDVSCDTCHTNSTAFDAILDISLDLAPHSTTAAPVRLDPRTQLSVVECLTRFTHLEKLHNNERFFCSKCNSPQDSTKQMSFHTLPHVLCLHLKRFDHSSRVGLKVENYVAFPLVGLDLTPYLHQQARAANMPSMPPVNSIQLPPRAPLYDLFCVIVHKGTLDTGHYICYLRIQLDWYKTDDRHVTKVDKSEVMNCNAYLLFYIRQQIVMTPRS